MNRAVFLDRDGVINEEINLLKHGTAPNFLKDYRQVSYVPRAAEAIRILNEAGLKIIVVTDQPVVARGLASEDDVRGIHERMQEHLASHGAHIDAFYFCPHHPERQHSDIPPHAMKYRIACECRKPGTGMLREAAKDFGIDLEGSYMVGDKTEDVAAGAAAGCVTLLVRTGYAGSDGKYSVKPDYVCSDIHEAAEIIAKLEKGGAR